MTDYYKVALNLVCAAALLYSGALTIRTGVWFLGVAASVEIALAAVFVNNAFEEMRL